jgi:polysaccharide export outer membrane protein
MRVTLAAAIGLAVAGCAAIPRDGPSPGSVAKAAREPTAHFALVDITYATTHEITEHTPAALALLASKQSEAPDDLIAPGDDVSISIYEAAEGGLFSRSTGMATTMAEQAPVPPQSDQQSLSGLVVDRDGNLSVPFGGRVHIAGLTPREASDKIRLSLEGKAVDPQVNLVVTNSRANTVGVVGEVHSPGHYPLAPSHDHLLDILESAGGSTQPPGDVLVVISRNGRSVAATMQDVLTVPENNIRLAPKDEIGVLEEPRKYTTFGALGRSSEYPITDSTLTLANALARAGGLDTNQANSRWVMVFRFEQPQIARALGVSLEPTTKGVPIVYRLNLRDPQGYFLADNFDVKSRDLIYVARSDLTEARKFLEFVNAVTSINYSVSAQAATAANIP